GQWRDCHNRQDQCMAELPIPQPTDSDHFIIWRVREFRHPWSMAALKFSPPGKVPDVH
ncbi:hypothetical protein A2U01_0087806, partial [Trifolium medium]|nr:hypothetical protein [Trifolium medium]